MASCNSCCVTEPLVYSLDAFQHMLSEAMKVRQGVHKLSESDIMLGPGPGPNFANMISGLALRRSAIIILEN